MGVPELPTPKSSANHVGQPPGRHYKEDICLITGEPELPTAQGHHEDALEQLELRCGACDEATEGKGSQNPCSPQEPSPVSSLGLCLLWGSSHWDPMKELKDLHRPKVHDPKSSVCHPPVTSGFHSELSDPIRQSQTHFAD